MRTWNWIALILIIVGAINWGLVGFFRFDLITAIFNGSLYWVSRLIFAIIGIAGLYGLTFFGRLDRDYDEEGEPSGSHR